jgi:4-amino-4-deoxy-L-arabinose transferase-like glycosyltransferase
MSEAGQIERRGGPVGRGYPQAALLAVAGLLVARLALVIVSPLELYADEAQYWRWGETLAWGYYSKPPMIAWLIRATTDLFGEAEWAVRFAAPVLHTAAAVFLFLTARAMFDARTGFFAALVYALMPAVGLSSHVISTDGVLLPFWCAALWCLWRLRSGEGGIATALALGAAFGLGMLAKYAMLYFLIGIAIAVLIDPPTREALRAGGRGLIALALAGLILAPHVAWNAANAFSTVSHTVDNASLAGELFNPGNALDYLADQMGVFGPVSFLALLAGLVFLRAREGEAAARERWLLGFILPVLVFILAQAILSRAHANWTATAYPAASILVAAWFCRAERRSGAGRPCSGRASVSMELLRACLPPFC